MDGCSNMPSRTAAEEEAGQNLCEFWARAWQEHDAALALQQMRNGTLWLSSTHIPPTNGLSCRRGVPAAEAAALDRALPSTEDTESEPENSVSRASSCQGLTFQRAAEGLHPTPCPTNALKLTEEAKRRVQDTILYSPAYKAGRGNKGVPHPRAAQKTVGAAGHRTTREAAASDVDARGRVAKAPTRGTTVAMNLKRSNGLKSARIQSLLKG
ncbi:hypothetical protein AYL99_00927 [Fonsecaea erecta]|uniref:Uncharacterized protein n=1 Tax=Fonsecaea erecta TaxID=1367422 RepID=A0A179A154_9EURO|nr:hypothetical protein AYL99_00927 [Fonsecaea erecta]OAP64955.1 hypothetical protein AYL99_00927 [Fonsecaea erecta]